MIDDIRQCEKDLITEKFDTSEWTTQNDIKGKKITHTQGKAPALFLI